MCPKCSNFLIKVKNISSFMCLWMSSKTCTVFLQHFSSGRRPQVTPDREEMGFFCVLKEIKTRSGYFMFYSVLSYLYTLYFSPFPFPFPFPLAVPLYAYFYSTGCYSGWISVETIVTINHLQICSDYRWTDSVLSLWDHPLSCRRLKRAQWSLSDKGF